MHRLTVEITTDYKLTAEDIMQSIMAYEPRTIFPLEGSSGALPEPSTAREILVASRLDSQLNLIDNTRERLRALEDMLAVNQPTDAPAVKAPPFLSCDRCGCMITEGDMCLVCQELRAEGDGCE